MKSQDRKVVAGRCSMKKGVLKKFTKFTWKHLCWSLFLIKLQTSGLQLYNFTKKETLTQVLSCEFRGIFKNSCFYRTPPVAAFEDRQNFLRHPHFKVKTPQIKLLLKIFTGCMIYLAEVCNCSKFCNSLTSVIPEINRKPSFTDNFRGNKN